MTSKEALKNFMKTLCEYETDTNNKGSVYPYWYELIEQDLERLKKLEKFKKLCLTKYVPLDSLSPSFWKIKEDWLEDMNYDYYLFLYEDVCEYVVKDDIKLTEKEFELVYEFLKEEL